MPDPILEELLRRQRESRFAPPQANKGRLLAAPEEPEAPGRLSRFADIFRDVVPEDVRDIVGGGLNAATSGEAAVNLAGRAFGNEQAGTQFRDALEDIPVVGGVAGAVFDVGAAPLTLATAGFGGSIAAGLRGLGTTGKLAAMLMDPISRSKTFAPRLVSEIVVGTGAIMAGEKAADAGLPTPVVVLTGLLGGITAAGAMGATKGAARTFMRNSAQIAGNQLGVTDSRTFIRDLLPADEVLKEIRGSANTFEETGAGRALNRRINPSKNLEGDIGKALNVYDRQIERGNLLSEVAVGALLDSHHTGAGLAFGEGGSILNIGPDGRITNIVPKTKGLSTAWGDVIERRDAAALYGMNAQQAALTKDIHQFADELNDYRAAHGLRTFKNPDEEIAHISRVVQGIREVDVAGRTNQFLERVHETMADGHAAGITYSNNPREVLNLMAQATYREHAGNQFDELIAPHALTAKTVLEKTHPQVVAGLRTSIKDLLAARKAVAAQRIIVMNARAQTDASTLSATRKLGAARQRLGGVMGRLRGSFEVQAKLPNADRNTTELYRTYQGAEDAAQRLRDVMADSGADQASYDSAHRELVTATGQLSKVIGEIQQSGVERRLPTARQAELQAARDAYAARIGGPPTRRTPAEAAFDRVKEAETRLAAARKLFDEPTGGNANAAAPDLIVARADLKAAMEAWRRLLPAETAPPSRAELSLLTAGKEKLRRLEAAQKRVANAEQLVKDTKPATGAARAAQRDLTAAKAKLARVEATITTESRITAGATSVPLATGRRLALAQRAVDDMTATIEQLGDYRKSLPRVRSASGPAITPAGGLLLENAIKANKAARGRYSRALENVKGSTVLPGYVFGNVSKDINVATWKGKFLPADADYKVLAERMNTITGTPLPSRLDPFSKSIQEIAGVVRLMSATGDAAAPFVNGLPLLGQNPLLWAKALSMQWRGLLDPAAVGRYAKKNLEAVQEMARYGVPIGDIEQYVAASQGGGLATPIHKFAGTRAGRQTLGRAEAGYDGFVTVARTEMWKALRPVWDGDLSELATYVRNGTGALSSRSLGVGAQQRALESVWLGFSPRLMRSTLALVVSAANPDSAAGRQAARSLLGLAAAGSALAVATNLGIARLRGEDMDEAWKRVEDTLNPTTGKFMSVDIGGQRIGVGGQVRAITQFVAKAVANPSGFATANAFENPLINFYMGRGSIGVNIAGSLVEGATGERVNVLPYESIDSLPDAALHLGSSLMPFVVQAQFEARDLSTIDRIVAASASFGGGNVSEKSPTDRINEITMAQYGKPFSELQGEEQQAVERDHADLFVLRDKRRADFGGREVREDQEHLKAIDQHRISGERALVDAFSRNEITAAQFRDEMKAIQRDAAVLKRDVRGEFDEQTTDENKLALSAWYNTFDQAKIEGTDLVDWDVQTKLEDELFSQMTAEQRIYVDRRRKTEHAEEAAPFFANEKTIKDAGYYDATDRAMSRMAGRLPPEIKSYSNLVLAIAAAKDVGDRITWRLLTNMKNAIDRMADREKRMMRRQNPTLDMALAANGRSELLAINH